MTGKLEERPLKIGRKKYNARQFFKITENLEGRYELIDGQIRLMASPSVTHQDIILALGRKIGDYLEDKPCRVFIAPLDVVLFEETEDSEAKEGDSQNVFQPDVFVVCDPGKISAKRINGAPDFIIEITSPSNLTDDYIDKLKAYMKHGVREYWILNPEKKTVLVYRNGKELENDAYTFEDKIKVNIFDDFEIDFRRLKL